MSSPFGSNDEKSCPVVCLASSHSSEPPQLLGEHAVVGLADAPQRGPEVTGPEPRGREEMYLLIRHLQDILTLELEVVRVRCRGNGDVKLICVG